MATNFRVKMGKMVLFTFIRSHDTPNGLQYRHSDFIKFISDDLATSCKHLKFGPVTPEFKRAKGVHPRRSAVWLRSLGGATATLCGISTEFSGAIITQFCFSYC